MSLQLIELRLDGGHLRLVARERNRRMKRGDLLAKPSHHGHQTVLRTRLHQPIRVDRGDARLVRLIHGLTRHIARRPIGKERRHAQLLRRIRPENLLPRRKLDAHQSRIITARRGRSLRDPVAQNPIVVARLVEPPTATVRHAGRGLEQQQAAIRSGGRQPPSSGFLDQRFVIHLRLKPEQRELEAVLPGRLAVTAAAVASELRQDRHDIGPEIDPAR